MKHTITPLALIIVACLIGCGQKDSYRPAPLTYFDQEPPGTFAVRFAPDIVSTNGHEHSRIEFGEDGRELYWVTVPVDSSNIFVQGTPFKIQEQNVWYSVYSEQGWSAPDTLPFGLRAKQSPVFLASRDVLYFGSIVSDSDMTRRRWFTSRTDGRWAIPVPETELPLPAANASYCFAGNGNLYFDSFGGINEQGRPLWEIYVAEFADGAYLRPQLVGGEVNDGGVNWTPWVAPDESYLIFSSHRGGNVGSGDLFISFKDASGNWSEPRNMGPSVNTDSQERFPSVSPDGKYFFFARNTDNASSDIFWISAAFIGDLKAGK